VDVCNQCGVELLESELEIGDGYCNACGHAIQATAAGNMIAVADHLRQSLHAAEAAVRRLESERQRLAEQVARQAHVAFCRVGTLHLN